MRSFIVPDGGNPAAQQGFAQIIAIHAALLHTGKIVYFGGDEHDPGRHHLHQFDHARLFDSATLTVSAPAPAPSITDLFCCGHAFLRSGKLLIAGGTEEWTIEQAGGADPHGHAALGHFRGLKSAWTYDPGSDSFHRVADMLHQDGQTAGGGRWYPTLLTLGDGRVVAISGHPSDADNLHFNYLLEAYDEDSNAWQSLTNLPSDITYYPRCYVLPNGTVFFASPMNGKSQTWNLATNTFVEVCPGPGAAYGGYNTTSVLLPLVPENGYAPSVLMCGASQAVVINFSSGSPAWAPTGGRTLIDPGSPPTSPVRANVNSVLLPTGDVAVVGGLRDAGNDPGSAVHQIELYEPVTDSWVTLPSAANLAVSRDYHSTALLMPDGRVWIAGSNIGCNWSYHNSSDYPGSLPTTAQDGAVDHRELRIEIFEPWYVSRGDRPSFTLPTTSMSTGSDFTINTPNAVTINRVVAIRAGSCTHSFDPDQRYVALPFSTASPTQLVVHVPSNQNLLPPGYYMLFILAQVVDPGTGAVLSVPSAGTFVQIHHVKLIKELKPELDVKSLAEVVKLPKELVEGPKDASEVELPWRDRGDPAFAKILERIDSLEARLAAAHVFIQKQERPVVGKQQIPRSFAAANQQIIEDPMGRLMGVGGMPNMAGVQDVGGKPA